MTLKDLMDGRKTRAGDLLIVRGYNDDKVIMVTSHVGLEGAVFIQLPPAVVGEMERYIRYNSEISYSTRLIPVENTEEYTEALEEYKKACLS